MKFPPSRATPLGHDIALMVTASAHRMLCAESDTAFTLQSLVGTVAAWL